MSVRRTLRTLIEKKQALLVPGAYDGCVPIDQVGRRNWTT